VNTKNIAQCVGELHGRIPGMIAESTPEHPRLEEVWWAEAVKLDFEEIDGRHWVLLKPETWIWPKRARKQAADFLDKRMGGRFNRQSDALLSAWIGLLFPSTERATDHVLAPFGGPEDASHPHFVVNARTAFSRKAIV
jgi:hypothetical protein